MFSLIQFKLITLRTLLFFCIFLKIQFALNFVNANDRIVICDGLNYIDNHLAGELYMFNEFNNIIKVILIYENDSTYYFEVLHKTGNLTNTEKIKVSPEFIDSLCREISKLENNIKIINETELNQEGRLELIAYSAYISFMYHSFAVPIALNLEEPMVYLASFLLIGGSGLVIPYLSTKDKEVTYGMSVGYINGTRLGIMHAWSFYAIMSDEFNLNERHGYGLSVLNGITEGVIGYSIAKKNKLSRGHVKLVGSGGIWGYAIGFTLPVLYDVNQINKLALSSLIGSGIGMFSGKYFAMKHPSLANGDVTIINTIGQIGALCATSISILALPNIELKTIYVSAITGSLLGLGYGLKKTQNRDYGIIESKILSISTFSVAFIGMFVFGSMSLDNEMLLFGATTGALTTFVFGDQLLKRYHSKTTGFLNNLEYNFNPLALGSLIDHSDTKSIFSLNDHQQNQLLSVSLKF